MGLLDSIKSIFGKGIIHVEGYDKTGRYFTGKTNFVGCIESEKEILDTCVEKITEQQNIRVDKIRVTGMYGYNGGDIVIKGGWYHYDY